jgi:hypothetical protein
MLLDTSALSTRCAELRDALSTKAPSKYLAYVVLCVNIRIDETEFRLSAALWDPCASRETRAFEFYQTGTDPSVLLQKLKDEISAFELWTPAAVAATLGLPAGEAN